MPNWQLNEHQEKFLFKLLAAQNCSESTVKCVQQMQLRIKENEAEIRESIATGISQLPDVITTSEMYDIIKGDK